MLELAPRSIGGLCSRALRFPGGKSLEELVLANALGHPPRPPAMTRPGPPACSCFPYRGQACSRQSRAAPTPPPCPESPA